ncbi:hypothetical protein F4780DRAFT_78151 [Xylariomycetidae sp. FL0641]|nr:hypothetical protein F4780DRAFT_78151 [Xylariomycetidae sp. FL0641]
MRIRLPFAGGFFLLCLLAGYAGLSSLQLGAVVNDKVLHIVTFFVLTIVFYWIVDTNRRRTLNLTLTVCTVVLGIGSEFLQGFLPNGREFDLYDIVANIVGSLAGLGLCSWYHMRMLERKRQRRLYNAVPGEEPTDLELGEGIGEQEEGITPTNAHQKTTSLEQEVDNWDENALDDWDDGDDAGVEMGTSKGKEPEHQAGEAADSKKRAD